MTKKRTSNFSAEALERMRNAKLGIPKSEEHRQRISAAMKGKRKSKAARYAMGAAQRKRRWTERLVESPLGESGV